MNKVALLLPEWLVAMSTGNFIQQGFNEVLLYCTFLSYILLLFQVGFPEQKDIIGNKVGLLEVGIVCL